MSSPFFSETNEKNEVFEVDKQIQETEAKCLEPQIVDVPGVGPVEVKGNPFELENDLDYSQGDNLFNVMGDCGLVSVINILAEAGISISEDAIVALALTNNLCLYDAWNSPEENGGTTYLDRQTLLAAFGIETEVYKGSSSQASLEVMADKIEAGHGVNISVNAGYALDQPSAIGDGSSNHSIIVTGTARDPQTGELKGFYVCDSCGLYDTGAVFMSVDKMKDCFTTVPYSSVIYTKEPIRSV